MKPTFIQIRRWLMQPEVWRLVGFASTVVGLLCYALSSSFNYLFGEWNLLKICLYSVFSFLICLAVLFAKLWQQSPILRFKAHLAVLVLTITAVYSFFFDKAGSRKPDAYSLISYAALAITSLSLSRQIHCGFEVDLLYFFLECLIVQLMKIKLVLAIVGAGFSYFLIILHSSIDAQPHGPQDEDQHQVVIQVDSRQANTDSAAFFMPQHAACIEALEMKNKDLIDMLMKQVKNYLEDDVDYYELATDHNFVIDSLPQEIINNLHETTKLMVAGGLEKECSEAYSSCRSEFLVYCQLKLRLQEIRMGKKCCNAFNVTLRILLPSERRLIDRVFLGFSSAADRCFADVSRRVTIRLLDFAHAVGNESPSAQPLFNILDVFETLGVLILESESQSFSTDGISASLSLVNPGIPIQNRLREILAVPKRWRDPICIFIGLGNMIFRIPETNLAVPANGGVHPITHNAMYYLRCACRSGQTPDVADRAGTSLLCLQIVWIMALLEGKLKVISRFYEDPALRYVFMMNNMRYLEQQVKEDCQLIMLLSDYWIRTNTAQVQQNLELYQLSSWNKVLGILELDSNEPVEPNVATEWIKEKLNLFNVHFREICKAQSTWLVSDEKQRDEIIISLENILLPAYGNFIGRFQKILGKQADEYIKYGMSDIQDRLNDLFRGRRE